MTHVRLGHEPSKVVDISDAEIEDLRRMGADVEVVKDDASAEETSGSNKSKGSK